MDKMSIINMLVVGVPEVMLSVVIMLLIAKGKDVFKKDIKTLIFKCVTSTVFILSFIYLIRNNISSLVLITFLNTLSCGLCMFLFWKCNIRQSLICGSLAMFIVVISEIVTVAPTTMLIVENLLEYNFMSAKLIWSLPTRIIQLLTLVVILIRNLTLEYNTILVAEWSKFTNNQKITATLSIVLVFIAIIFSTNYSEFYVKMKINNINIKLFKSSMSLLLFQSIIYLMTTLVLLNRTSKYEDYKNILHRNPDEIISILKSVNYLEGGDYNE